jgi:hypothetical protein
VDNDSMVERRDEDDNVPDEPEVSAAAVVVSSMTQGNMESGQVGPLAATLPGYVAAHDLNAAEDEPDDAKLNLDALEAFGSKARESGDEGVSAAQSEVEADELNG